MLGMLAGQRPSLGDACQRGKMAALLNSLLFVFKMSLLPKYHVKYYDYIVVKWCSGIACNWCALLDIDLSLVSKGNTIVEMYNLKMYACSSVLFLCRGWRGEMESLGTLALQDLQAMSSSFL